MRPQVFGWLMLAVIGGLLLVGAVMLGWVNTQNAHPPLRAMVCADIVAGCELPEAGLHVAFDHHPQIMQPFHITVRVLGAHAVYARFNMRNMTMGMNRYRFVAGGANTWKAEATLPVCVQGRSDWMMVLDVDGRAYRLDFTAG